MGPFESVDAEHGLSVFEITLVHAFLRHFSPSCHAPGHIMTTISYPGNRKKRAARGGVPQISWPSGFCTSCSDFHHLYLECSRTFQECVVGEIPRWNTWGSWMRSVVTSVSSSLPTHGHSFALSRQGLLGASNNKAWAPGESPILFLMCSWGPHSDLLLVHGSSRRCFLTSSINSQTPSFLTFLHLKTINFPETLKNLEGSGWHIWNLLNISG